MRHTRTLTHTRTRPYLCVNTPAKSQTNQINKKRIHGVVINTIAFKGHG